MISRAGASPSATNEPVAAEPRTRRDGGGRRCAALLGMRGASSVRHRPRWQDDGVLRLRVPSVSGDAIGAGQFATGPASLNSSRVSLCHDRSAKKAAALVADLFKYLLSLKLS